jgi:hypothetical protein
MYPIFLKNNATNTELFVVGCLLNYFDQLKNYLQKNLLFPQVHSQHKLS